MSGFFQSTIDLLRGKMTLSDYIRKRPLETSVLKLMGAKKRADFVSLGFNCEVSQRFQDAFPQGISHYLFTWTYDHDRNLFLEALKNLDNVADSEYEVLPVGMITNLRYQISFHPKNHTKDDLFNEDGTLSDKVPEAITELKSRITHLALKTKNLNKTVKKIKFVMKLNNVSPKNDIDFLRNLNSILNDLYTDYVLIVVTSKEIHNDDEFEFISEHFEDDDRVNLYRIKSYAPSGDTSHGGDVKGWLNIIKKYM